MKALAAILDYEQKSGEIPPRAAEPRDERSEAVISAALLVSTAFRMRDESSLVFALRRLADAVASFEKARLPA